MDARIVLMVIGCLSAIQAFADHVDDPVAERQGVMKRIGTEMKGLALLFGGKVEWDPTLATASALSIQANISQDLPALFQDHVNGHPESRAKDIINQQWPDFSDRFVALNQRISGLLADIPNGFEQAQYSFKAVSESCSDCHNRYRTKINER